MHYIREYGTTVLIVVAGALLAYKLASGGTHPLTGQMAPDFSLPLVSGETVSLASHRGKDVVILDFWASWCPPCREGLPLLDKVARSQEGAPVAIYAVNIREGRNLVSEFARTNQLTLPILLDNTGVVADDYGVTGIPQTVIIDRSGRIHAVHVGLSMWGFEDTLAADIQAALASSVSAP
jgi:peroxiredoxin